MSKINVKAILKSNNEVHTFEGKGILNNNQITYNDNGIMTKLILDDTVILERENDYKLKLGFCINNKYQGTYIINEGKLTVETFTNYLKKEKNSIKIKYNLKINNVNIDDFEYILTFTIDR